MKKRFQYKIIGLVLAGCLSVAASTSNASLPPGIPVLSYHKVQDNFTNSLAISVKDFEQQMAYLHNQGYHTISPDQLLNFLEKGVSLPDKAVMITFDDGYRDNYTAAYPIMQKYGFTATIFLYTDAIGSGERYLDWNQIEEMRRGGFVFGSHSLSHISLTSVSSEYAMRELIRSREEMEWRLSAPVKYFAYPGGDYNEKVEQLARQAGYTAAFSTKFGRVTTNGDIYALERIPIFRSKLTFVSFYLRLNCTQLVGSLKAVREAVVNEIRPHSMKTM